MGTSTSEDDTVGDDTVDVLLACARASAMASARVLSAAVAVADQSRAGFDADEVAYAMAWTQGHARRQVELGRYLIGTLPAVFAACLTGDLDAARAYVFFDVLAVADDDVAQRVAERVLPVAAALTTTQVRDRLRRALLREDPDGAAKRTRRTIEHRYVATVPDGEGTTALFGVHLPATRATAAFERVDALARAIKLGGDDRTLAQLRADTLLDLLEGIGIGAAPIHRAGVIELSIPWATAIGLADEPATLAGYGPIAATIARELLDAYGDDAEWRYSVHGPDGDLLRHGRTPAPRPPMDADPDRRSPTAPLRRWIAARDRTCRAPGCTVPARSTDIDHTVDHAHGGPTVDSNLALLCRHHHRAKHEGGWTVTQSSPGHLTWTSPTGRKYRRDPDPPW